MEKLFHKYFKYFEFDSKTQKDSGLLMKEEFLHRLAYARHIAKTPFKINHGWRTDEDTFRLIKKGYAVAKNSPHLRGWAADISARTSRERFIITQALLEAGFTRIGIGKSFIHVDCDPSKTQNLIWTYDY